MVYSEAQRKATLRYRQKNIERTRQLARFNWSNWYQNHREEECNRVREIQQRKRDIKKLMLILIDENI